MRNALVVIVVLLLIWNLYLNCEHPEEVVVSSVDGLRYVVKSNYRDKEAASDILARLNAINIMLINKMKRRYKHTGREAEIMFLAKNYNGDVLAEHTPRGTVNTSYVLNKGDAIKLCLRDPTTGRLHEFSTLLFVNLHELSHLLDRQWGHKDSFWSGFAFLLREAHAMGLYKPIDYRKKPTKYCGIEIKSNPYFMVGEDPQPLFSDGDPGILPDPAGSQEGFTRDAAAPHFSNGMLGV